MENYDFRRTSTLVLYLFIILISTGASSMANNDPKVQLIGSYTVVLDAGHGGKDQGAKGKICLEKEVNLSVCLLTAQLLKESMPNGQIILTRDQDQFVSLQKRAQAANQNKANLFISLHCNAHTDKTVRGSESYIMGLHKTEENLQVAKTENASFLQEVDSFELEHDSPESHILLAHYQEQNLWEGLRIADFCESSFKLHHPGGSRGVKQAGFLVLHQVYMPAVLVELGYISHPDEEAWLCSFDGQLELAQTLAISITNYFAQQEFLAKQN